MKPYFPSKVLEEENDKLVEAYLNSFENISPDEFVDKYASKAFKEYLIKAEKRRKRLLAKGIIEN